MLTRGVYAILDLKADELIGHSLPIHKHEAAAVRMFQDALTDQNGFLGKHPEDFNLVRLGYVDELGVLTPSMHVVLTGEAWASLQRQASATPTATLHLEDRR